jgi:hypothetical protein
MVDRRAVLAKAARPPRMDPARSLCYGPRPLRHCGATPLERAAKARRDGQ